uniref:RING-Gid-type domain-containing protein n=1 Tax=Caenorhabditis japonica TaxID=281687 RepID=A0A8R1E7V1_CAEJA
MKHLWHKNLISLESSLEIMRDELFDNAEGREISITGQILMEGASERAKKLVKESATCHKTIHFALVKLQKTLDRNLDTFPWVSFKLKRNLVYIPPGKEQSLSMIYDLLMTDGLNGTAEVLKEECNMDKYNVYDPYTLKQIVDDLRDGEICSSLEYLETWHPTEEKFLRSKLQTQMITDCIEMDNYERAVDQLKLFKRPWEDERLKGPRLLGALLIGKTSMCDNRYRDLFDNGNREDIQHKMTSFFLPSDSPLRLIMRFGTQALSQLSEWGLSGYNSSYYVENELPIEVPVIPTHSAFTCPILKEQCSSDNPAMRLVCGHVISRDAIARLTNVLRPVRNSSRYVYRHSRFKCPYCPREQIMDTAKKVDFSKWQNDDDFNEGGRKMETMDEHSPE